MEEVVFEEVISRLKTGVGVKTDSELANGLNISSSAFANRRKGKALPFAKIISLAVAFDVSLDWLFTGVGLQKNDDLKSGQAVEITIRLMGDAGSNGR